MGEGSPKQKAILGTKNWKGNSPGLYSPFQSDIKASVAPKTPWTLTKKSSCIISPPHSYVSLSALVWGWGWVFLCMHGHMEAGSQLWGSSFELCTLILDPHQPGAHASLRNLSAPSCLPPNTEIISTPSLYRGARAWTLILRLAQHVVHRTILPAPK